VTTRSSAVCAALFHLAVQEGGNEDVKAAFELEANRDLDAYFDRWIYGSSLPRIRFSYTIEPDAVVVRFEQIGERFEVPVTVTLKHAAASTDVTVAVTDQVTTSAFRLPRRSAAWA
jgi:hypothetical protein